MQGLKASGAMSRGTCPLTCPANPTPDEYQRLTYYHNMTAYELEALCRKCSIQDSEQS
jgi:hypothetical protein